MRRSLITASILSLTLIGGASVAVAQEVSASTCRDMEVQVRSALTSSQAGDREAAQKEQNTGRNFCNHGFYRVGMDHFEQALKLLNAKT
ncbi:MAG: hypothetical protein JO056_06560 [Alphaproteobacteria bacterium]|nr:hypothetical protein [Alphaproteobacteria bacterium]